VFVVEGDRWALNIDPQSQAMGWIRKMEDKLILADSKDPTFIKKIEFAI